MPFRKRLTAFMLAFLIVLGTWFFTREPEPVAALSIDRQLIIKLSPGIPISSITSRLGLRLVDQLLDQREFLVEVPLLGNVTALIPIIDALPGVEDVGPNLLMWTHRRPHGYDGDDPQALGSAPDAYQSQQLTGFLNTEAMRSMTEGGAVKVAVIDTGVDLYHPGLAGQLATDGYDFVDRDLVAYDEIGGSGSGHGTFAAGLILRLAPQTRILPVRVLQRDGSGNSFQVAAGIYYAADHGAKVINLSLGTDRDTGMMRRAIAYAQSRDCLVVAAMGNDGLNASDVFPAAYANVIGVAATDFADQKASFSNYGPLVDVCAPGVGLVSTYTQGTYARWSGTSFAAPLVSAEAALLLSQGRTSASSAYTLQSSCIPISQTQYKLGAGRISPLAALSR